MLRRWAKTICDLLFLALFVWLGVTRTIYVLNGWDEIGALSIIVVAGSLAIAVVFGAKAKKSVERLIVDAANKAEQADQPAESTPHKSAEPIKPATVLKNNTLPEPSFVYPPSPKKPTAKVQIQTNTLDEFSRYGGVDAELLTVDLMNNRDFTSWCADALRDMGYEDVRVTPSSGNQGVDILGEKSGMKYAFKCRHADATLGNTPVQEVHAGKYYYHCHIGIVITNQHFSSAAKELADATGILLWDREWIKGYISNKAQSDGSVLIKHAPANRMLDPAPSAAELDGDEMLPLAVDVVLETKQASVSIIQRRLKVSYARAARIMDEMEEKGIVGPFVGNHPRQILITKDQWEQMKETNSQGSDDFDVNTLYQHIDDNPENFRRVDTDSEMAAFLREYTLEREIRTSVKGVTFRNDDGSNRQSILAQCHRGDSIVPMFYFYNGDPACAVITDYGQIGHLSADLAQDIHDGYADYMINGEILAVTGGNAGRNLGCNIVLRLYRKIQQ